MRIKRSFLIFLVSLALIITALSVAIYAYAYVESLSSTSSSSSAPLDTSVSNSTGPDNQAPPESTSTVQEGFAPKLYNESTHPYNTWNSPYTFGVDGYNYTDPQDYTGTAEASTTP